VRIRASAALWIGITSAAGGLAASAALAVQPQRVAVSGHWSVFRVGSGASSECFAYSVPTKSEGKYTTRGEVMVQVTHRPKQRVRDEISFTAGYTFKSGSALAVEVDGKKFELFTHEDRAYARDAASDRALAESMMKGNQMIARGTSSRGTQTIDRYSLTGFTRAHQTLDKACSG
jgi:hypothetical protein